MLGSASNDAGGGAGLCFLQEHGGIPPTPPFRRVLAGTDGIFDGGIEERIEFVVILEIILSGFYC